MPTSVGHCSKYPKNIRIEKLKPENFLNHIQDTIATTLSNAVNVSNKLFGISIVVPSWIYN